MLTKTIRIVVAAVGLMSAAVVYAEVLPEKVFEHASDYTVQVKTRIEHAFGGDVVGSFGGTGFIVDAERGWVVTNRHVVGESPSEVHVARRDGRYEPATKLYVDPYIDIAILETDLDGGRQAEMDCGHPVPGTGHPVGAYGHPWGFEYTGTQGVISGRTTKWERLMLQTDAPINAGNSGGPLISMRTGAVVGVNTSKYNDKNSENTNFAIPVEDVCQIVALLKQGKDPAPPRLPVAFLDLEDPNAVVVARQFDSQASIGLQAGDRMNALRGNLEGARLKVARDGRELTITADIPPMRIRRGVEFAGIVMAPFNYKDGSITPAGHDIGVFSVTPGSPASSKDLKAFDLIYRVNGQMVESLEQLFVLLNDLEDGAIVKLQFLRVFEDMHYFGYIERQLRAEPAVWLDSNGASSGTGVQLSWIASELDDEPVISTRKYLMLTVALQRLLHELEDDHLRLDAEEKRQQHALAVTLAEKLGSGDRVATLNSD
jgi:S1-C subfamily serine protease